MWLLSTSRAELKTFPDVRSLTGGFAILSHTWSGSEQTFQEVQKICTECKESGVNPRDVVADKIRNCCLIAERDGYEWVWVDSCCIDKSSSTELSEAINSMFDWYVLAEVCYVYLEDVGSDPKEDSSEFLAARWHTRGWTLQELLAPEMIVFLSADWKRIGTKHSLSSLLSNATRIDVKYLTREWDMFDAPISLRMYWASERRTTRVEDEAYCLLGIFNINMPTLYGEGRRAFQRLQLEIVKQSQDTTLFAWGWWDEGSFFPGTLATILSRPTFPGTHRFLLAPSPREYDNAGDYYYTPRLSNTRVLQPYLPSQWSLEHKCEIPDADDKQKTGPFGTIELPSFEVTSYGMKCRFPVSEIDGITIAVLLIQTADQHVGLFLYPAPEVEALDPTRSLYYTSWIFSDNQIEGTHRLAHLGGDLYNLHYRGKPIHASWKTIYIRTGCDVPSDRTDVAWTVFKNAPVHSSLAPFRLSPSVINAMSALGMLFTSGGLPCLKSESQPQLWYRFFQRNLAESITIRLGVCAVTGHRHVWAYALEKHWDTWGHRLDHEGHDCATDHISDWPNYTRMLGKDPEERQITLWFTDCMYAPQTVVLHIHLGGCTYEGMLREANITLPSPGPQGVVMPMTLPATVQRGSASSAIPPPFPDSSSPPSPTVITT